MIRYLAAAYLLTVVSCAPPFYPEGRKISEVEIIIEGRETVDEKRLRSMMKTQPGTHYAASHLDEDIRTLYGSGLVEDVMFLAEPDGEAVRVEAKIILRPPLGPGPKIAGNTIFKDERLAKESKLKEPFTARNVEKARINMEKFYRRQGYKDVKVSIGYFKATDPADGDPLLNGDFIFQIEEGTKSP